MVTNTQNGKQLLDLPFRLASSLDTTYGLPSSLLLYPSPMAVDDAVSVQSDDYSPGLPVWICLCTNYIPLRLSLKTLAF